MESRISIRIIAIILLFLPSLCFLNCGGDNGNDENKHSTSYNVGGAVAGLSGTLFIQNNGKDEIVIVENGNFTFPTKLTDGADYNVTISQQPQDETCSITNGSGTIDGADISNILVNCSVITYSIGGTLSGLVGSLTIQNNGGDDLLINSDNSFAFPTQLPNDTNYEVTILSKPSNQYCTVTNGSGKVNRANVSNIAVNCSYLTFTLGGNVSGLTGTLVLQNNGGDNHTITENGSFTFSTPVIEGSTYNVVVSSQPLDEICSVSNGSGTVSGADITNVSVICSNITYTVGGSVSGLSGTLVLQNNGGDDLNLDSDGFFTFLTPLVNSASYNVTVHTQPSNQVCAVSSGSGNIDRANVSNIGVSCVNTYSVGGNVTGFAHNFTLQNNGSDDLTITGDGSFIFSTRLLNGASYDVTLSSPPTNQYCKLTNASGTISEANITNITVHCNNWTYPASRNDNISPDGYRADSPHVAMDDNGNSIIVWNGRDTTDKDQIFKAEYQNNSWSFPSGVVDNISPDNYYAEYPRVAMDNNGNAIIVWQQAINSSTSHIYKSEYRNGSWTHPADINDKIDPSGGGLCYHPQVAMDNNGNAIIVWFQEAPTTYQIFKSEYRNGSWTHPSSLNDNISPDGQHAEHPRVAMDDDENALIVWKQSDGTNKQVFKSEYRSGSWTNPTSLNDNISPDGQDVLTTPHPAMDNNGNSIVSWMQYDGSNYQIFKSEYRSATWVHPSGLTDNISPNGQDAELGFFSKISMDDNGNSIISWHQSDSSYYQIFKSECRSGVWTHPANLNDNISPNGQHASNTQSMMDNNGNGLITWLQSDGSQQQLFKSEYHNGSWTHPSSLTDNLSPDGSGANYQEMAMDNNGNSIIVWFQTDTSGNYQIFKSEYR